MKYRKNIMYCLLMLCCMPLAFSQPPSRFYTRFGGGGYDYGYDVKQTLDKGYVITGSTSSMGQGNTDAYLVKLDSMGTQKWQSAFGSFNNETARSVTQLADSSYVIAGYTNSSGFGGYDFYMVAADKNGNFLWEKTYGGSDWDFGYSMKPTSDGGFILCGTTYSYGRGQADGYVIKTDAAGAVQWTKTYGGAKDDEFKCVIQTSDGGYALTGYTKSYADPTNGDAWVFKLDAAGDSVWCQFHGGAQEDYMNDILEYYTGEFYTAGATSSYGTGKLDAYALKLTTLGGLIWHSEDGHAGTDEAYYKVLVSQVDNTHTVYIEKDNFSGYGIQIKIMDLKSGGYYYYAANYGDPQADEFYGFANTKDKGYACVGYTYGFNANLVDIYFLKIDSALYNNPQSIVTVHELSEQKQFAIYPTVCSHDLYVDFGKESTSENASMKIFNMEGDELPITSKEQINTGANTKYKLEFDLDPGIYLLSVNGCTRKFVIVE